MSGGGNDNNKGPYILSDGRELGPDGRPRARAEISDTPVTPGGPGRPGGSTGSRRVQPFMPGFDRAIAEQLGMGMGGAPNDYLAAFNQIFSPMNIPTYGGPNNEGGGGISDVPERPGDKTNRKSPIGTGGGGVVRIPGGSGSGRRPADR